MPSLYNCGVNEEISLVITRFDRFRGEIVEWLIYAGDFLVSADKLPTCMMGGGKFFEFLEAPKMSEKSCTQFTLTLFIRCSQNQIKLFVLHCHCSRC